MESLELDSARDVAPEGFEETPALRIGERPLWPGRLRALALRLHGDGGASNGAALEEFWRLLNLALHRYVRLHGRRFGPLSADDVFDVSADKGLHLVGRLRRADWDPGAGTEEQLCAFLSSVARHGVIDLVRRRRREAPAPRRADGPDALFPLERARPPGASPLLCDGEAAVDSARYAATLLDCVKRLTARARLAFYLRVFAGLSAASIGRHPEILTSPAGADLILNRSRRQVRKCLAARGLEPRAIPPGTFAALWDGIDAARRAPRGSGGPQGGGR
jgi:DNA-directed RNA polymerase specialized sigma24 family protein